VSHTVLVTSNYIGENTCVMRYVLPFNDS